MLLFAAFTVTLGTLLIQGLTLRPLVLALRVPEDTAVDREVRHARLATVQAALAALSEDRGEEAEVLRARLQGESQAAGEGQDTLGPPDLSSTALREKILAVRRDRLLALRSDGVIGDDAFHRLEEELDFADLALTARR
jgi:CPA1 family monovalent cation:H+ antiporter